MDILKKLQMYTDYSLEKSSERVEIQYMDTSFHELVFTGYDLNNTEFLEVSFLQCDFTDVYLSGSNLSGSIFQKCIFYNNCFRKGMAEYASFHQTDIKKMDSFRTDFYEANFDDLVIEDSRMCNCFFAGASFSNVVFQNVDLTKTSFKRSKFENVKFIGCDLSGTIFDEAGGLENVIFTDLKND